MFLLFRPENYAFYKKITYLVNTLFNSNGNNKLIPSAWNRSCEFRDKYINMGTISQNGKRINFYQAGNGSQDVIFLHGYGENARIWNYVNQDLPFNSIAIDFPGFGQSDMQEDISMYRLGEIIREIVVELQLNNPILIGHSMGGYAALAYANEYPEETAGIGLLNTHPFADNAQRIRERNKSIQFIKKYGSAKYVNLLYDSLFYSSKSFLKNTRQHLIDQHKDIDEKILITYIKAMRDRLGYTDFVSQWKRPFLFLLGKHDTLIPWEKQVSQAALAPVSELVIMQKSGHMSHLTERLKTHEAIVKFVKFVELMSNG